MDSERSVEKQLQPVLIQVHVTFTCSDRDLENVYEQCKVLLEKRYQAVTTDGRSYQLYMKGDLEEEALDAEIDRLYFDIYDLAEDHNCSLKTEIHEVGGLERAWE